jgi:hypothetical protein
MHWRRLLQAGIGRFDVLDQTLRRDFQTLWSPTTWIIVSCHLQHWPNCKTVGKRKWKIGDSQSNTLFYEEKNTEK